MIELIIARLADLRAAAETRRKAGGDSYALGWLVAHLEALSSELLRLDDAREVAHQDYAGGSSAEGSTQEVLDAVEPGLGVYEGVYRRGESVGEFEAHDGQEPVRVAAGLKPSDVDKPVRVGVDEAADDALDIPGLGQVSHGEDSSEVRGVGGVRPAGAGERTVGEATDSTGSEVPRVPADGCSATGSSDGGPVGEVPPTLPDRAVSMLQLVGVELTAWQVDHLRALLARCDDGGER